MKGDLKLSDVARKFGVEISTVLAFLNSKNIFINSDPNSLVDFIYCDLLNEDIKKNKTLSVVEPKLDEKSKSVVKKLSSSVTLGKIELPTEQKKDPPKTSDSKRDLNRFTSRVQIYYGMVHFNQNVQSSELTSYLTLHEFLRGRTYENEVEGMLQVDQIEGDLKRGNKYFRNLDNYFFPEEALIEYFDNIEVDIKLYIDSNWENDCVPLTEKNYVIILKKCKEELGFRYKKIGEQKKYFFKRGELKLLLKNIYDELEREIIEGIIIKTNKKREEKASEKVVAPKDEVQSIKIDDREKFANELLKVIMQITGNDQIEVRVDSNPTEGTAFIYNFQNINLINNDLKKKIASQDNQFLLEYIMRQGVEEIILNHKELDEYEKIDLGWVAFCIKNKGSINAAYESPKDEVQSIKIDNKQSPPTIKPFIEPTVKQQYIEFSENGTNLNNDVIPFAQELGKYILNLEKRKGNLVISDIEAEVINYTCLQLLKEGKTDSFEFMEYAEKYSKYAEEMFDSYDSSHSAAAQMGVIQNMEWAGMKNFVKEYYKNNHGLTVNI